MRTHGQQLQAAYRQHIAPYSEHLQFAVTLTLKQSAQIVTTYANGEGTYKRCEYLDEDKLRSTINRFDALLRYACYQRLCRRQANQAWAMPLAIYSVEGRNTHKRTHIHAAMGNVPQNKLSIFPALVESAWKQCDFGDKQICVKPITNAAGWVSYMTKEIGYTDNDCLDISSAVIPPFIQQRA